MGITALPPVDTATVLCSASPVATPALLPANVTEEQCSNLLDFLNSDKPVDNLFLNLPHAVNPPQLHAISSPPCVEQIGNQTNALLIDTPMFNFNNYSFDHFSTFGMDGATSGDSANSMTAFLHEDLSQNVQPMQALDFPVPLVAMGHVADVAPSITGHLNASPIAPGNALTPLLSTCSPNVTPAAASPVNSPALDSNVSTADVMNDEVPLNATVQAANAKPAKKAGVGKKSTGVGKKVGAGKKAGVGKKAGAGKKAATAGEAGNMKATQMKLRKVLEEHGINIAPLTDSEQASPPDDNSITATRSQRSSKRPAPADEGCTWAPKAAKKKAKRN